MNKARAIFHSLILACFVIILFSAPGYCGGQKKIQYARLSLEATEQEPLYNIIAVGKPEGHYLAVMSMRNNRCKIAIINALNNKTVFTFQRRDKNRCSDDDDFEDGAAMHKALQFLDFINTYHEAIKPVLVRYNINPQKYHGARKSSRSNGKIVDKRVVHWTGGQKQCVITGKLLVCRNHKKLSVSMTMKH